MMSEGRCSFKSPCPPSSPSRPPRPNFSHPSRSIYMRSSLSGVCYWDLPSAMLPSRKRVVTTLGGSLSSAPDSSGTVLSLILTLLLAVEAARSVPLLSQPAWGVGTDYVFSLLDLRLLIHMGLSISEILSLLPARVCFLSSSQAFPAPLKASSGTQRLACFPQVSKA